MRKRVRTVELQLLRHGPSHNQLLSPLTDYLALCGDHPNTTLHFPIEHQSLRVRLHALRYKDSEDTRKIQLHETASLVGHMLSEVPGLISELGHRDSNAESLVHLSVATTASELSLVPFELASAPPGFPGAGGSLSLQTEFPTSITRRSRKVRFDELNWNVVPRILMIASNAGGDIPLEAHYALLRKLVEPWVFKNPLEANDGSLAEVYKHLVLVDDATVRRVRETIHGAIDQNQPFTHVHVLAHGCPLPNQVESHGIAFHHPNGNGIDAVDGFRLGQLLIGKLRNELPRRLKGDELRPNVVTLAVCDSGNTGMDVSRPGSSVAFNIHEAGIPLVVGSQFPLTKDGSVVLTESIYRQLLDGCDPRICLWEARRDVFAQSTEKLSANSVGRHDWASIVSFAALPPDIELSSKMLEQAQYRKRMNAKLDSGDKLIEALHAMHSGRSPQRVISSEVIDGVATEVKTEVQRFDRFVDDRNAEVTNNVDLLGVSASANKRAAELLWAATENSDSKNRNGNSRAWLECVWRSYRCYLLVSRRDANKTWAFVQALFLKRFLSFYGHAYKDFPEHQERELYEDWFRARYLCADRDQHECISPIDLIYHLTDKVELGLLRMLIPWFDGKSEGVRADLRNEFSKEAILGWLRRMDDIAVGTGRSDQFAVYAGRRQLLRYRTYADMMFVEPGRKNKSESKKVTSERGCDRLIALYPEFGGAFTAVETHIRKQIAVGKI